MRGMFFGAYGVGNAIYRGTTCNMGECAIGRLVFISSGNITKQRTAAQIFVADSMQSAQNLFEEIPDHTVGIVMTEVRPSERILRAAAQSGIPFLFLDTLPKRHNAKTAILDTSSAALFVDPDVETLDRYSKSFGASADTADILSPHLSYFRFARSEMGIASEISGAMHLCSAGRYGEIRSEDELFDDYRDICENSGDIEVTFLLSPAYPLTGTANERFLTHLRAIFRAAVYGRATVLCGGPCTATVKGISACFDAIEKAKDSLLLTGYEYNTEIKCGLLISSPLILCSIEKLPKFDFICLELENLTRLFTNLTTGAAIADGAACEVCEAVNRIIFEKRKRSPITCAAVKCDNAVFFSEYGKIDSGIKSFFIRR